MVIWSNIKSILKDEEYCDIKILPDIYNQMQYRIVVTKTGIDRKPPANNHKRLNEPFPDSSHFFFVNWKQGVAWQV